MPKNESLNPIKVLKEELGLQPGDKVADLGCGGAGYFSFAAAQVVGSSGQVHAVDVLKSSLSAVEHQIKANKINNIQTHWSDLERFGALKINDSSMDVVLLVNTLFQNKDKAAVLKEATRLLGAGSKLLVIDWLPGRFPMGPPPEAKVSADAVGDMVARFGLKEVKEFQAGEYHYGLIFQKA